MPKFLSHLEYLGADSTEIYNATMQMYEAASTKISRRSENRTAATDNPQLQNANNNATIKEKNILGGEGNGSQNAELLAGRGVSAVGGNGNGIRQQGENSQKIAYFLEGISVRGSGNGETSLRAGDSGWLVRSAEETGEESNRFEESIRRKVPRIKLSGFDTIGRKVSEEIKAKFKDTIFKDENGNLLSLYHWTTARFDKFLKGEFGFHFGTLDAAHDRYSQELEEDPNTPIGNYKEAYINIKNPLYINYDAGIWDANGISIWLKENKLITEAEYEFIRAMEGFYEATYDNPAANALREMLKEKGYDGIIYKNDSEDRASCSVIAFSADQILTVAENGVLKDNSGVSEADFSEPAFSAPDDNRESRLDYTERELGFAEPPKSEISSKPSAEESVTKGINAALGIENKTNAQKHIESVAEKLSSVKGVVWDSKVEVGQSYIDSRGKVHFNPNVSISESYGYLFKHEFSHSLESKRKFEGFRKWLIQDSRSFNDFVRIILVAEGIDESALSRSEAFERLKEIYIERYSEKYGKYSAEKQSELAEYEIVADYVGLILFHSEGYESVAKGLREGIIIAENDDFSLQALTEMAQKDRSFIQKLIDFIKEFIDRISGKAQNRSLAEDLQYAEKYLEKVYNSKDIAVDNEGADDVKWSTWNEYKSYAMSWANESGRKQGDTKILNRNGKGYVLIVADGQGGYAEVATGSYLEVKANEKTHRENENSIYRNIEEFRSESRGSSSSYNFNEIKRNDGGNSGSAGSEGFQNDAAGNTEYLRGSNNGASKANGATSVTEVAFSVPENNH